MHAIGPVIRLDDDNDMREIYFPHDWHVDEHARLVYYLPSKLAFLIDYDEPAEGEWVKPSHLSARLVHTCDGAKVHRSARLRRIAKDAIHAFVLIARACKDPAWEDEIPF